MVKVAVANQKGGVGKTTVVASLAAALAQKGKRTLAVDLDPQMALTSWFFGEGIDRRTTVYEALFAPETLPETVIATEEGFSLAVSSLNLAGAEFELLSLPDRHYRLAQALRYSPSYEWVLIDCPPSLGLLTLNALVASDFVLIPVSCEFLALRGLGLLLSTVKRVRKSLNTRLQILGILPTLYEGRTLHAREAVDVLSRRFGELVLLPVRKSVRFREAPVARKSILVYDPRGRGAEGFLALAEEVIRRAEARIA